MYGHGGKLGNECADHAATHGTFGLASSHNVATRWIHNNFDASVRFRGCNNITEVLEQLQRMRTDAASTFQNQSQCCVHHRVHWVSCASYVQCVLFVFASSVFLLWAFRLRMYTFSSEQVMESLSSAISTAPIFDDYFVHNMWNPLLELLLHEQVSGIFGTFVDEFDLAKIALSCHFALDLLCYIKGAYHSAWRFVGHRCHTCVIEILNFCYLEHSHSLRQRRVSTLTALSHTLRGLVAGRLKDGDAHASRQVWSIDGASKCPIAAHWGFHRLGWCEFDLPVGTFHTESICLCSTLLCKPFVHCPFLPLPHLDYGTRPSPLWRMDVNIFALISSRSWRKGLCTGWGWRERDDDGCHFVLHKIQHIYVSRWLSQTIGLVSARKSVFHCFLLHSVCVVRVMRRGRDHHLHGQVFVPPEGARASVAATFCRAAVLQR